MLDEIVLFSKDFQVHLKGGTKESIVDRLSHRATSGARARLLWRRALTIVESDIVVFLLCYREFISPFDLLKRLTERFLLQASPDPSIDAKDWDLMHKGIRAKYARPCAHECTDTRRLARILRLWVENHFHDFVNQPQLLQALDNALKKTFASLPEYAHLAIEIVDLVNQQEKVSYVTRSTFASL